MQISVTFKNLDPSDHLKSYVQNKLNKLDKLLDNPAEANVVLSVEKIRHIAEIKIIGDRLSINCREKTSDMYSSIDMALDKLEKQIKKNKQKIRNHRQGTRSELKGRETLPEEISSSSVDESSEPQIRVQNIDFKPMDVEEASMQMDLVPDNFIVFTNSRTNRVNVLYRRKDGDLGLIQPRS
ncbi:MAG: ribosome-associated translation inhibitor RaiA [Desulfobacteraceae bacterium]|nr:ribosome-associated translation inhibitor RaiA [Desulfobacteraceae bacterium]MBC2757077.1 ribosome-associated translation inhibitor RaiA [Desulfobacteraceae bacterium]MBC2763706.1 ribosome-associated translation inhibitor RaiA [ANME-2 cluster archaeon]